MMLSQKIKSARAPAGIFLKAVSLSQFIPLCSFIVVLHTRLSIKLTGRHLAPDRIYFTLTWIQLMQADLKQSQESLHIFQHYHNPDCELGS